MWKRSSLISSVCIFMECMERVLGIAYQSGMHSSIKTLLCMSQIRPCSFLAELNSAIL